MDFKNTELFNLSGLSYNEVKTLKKLVDAQSDTNPDDAVINTLKRKVAFLNDIVAEPIIASAVHQGFHEE